MRDHQAGYRSIFMNSHCVFLEMCVTPGVMLLANRILYYFYGLLCRAHLKLGVLSGSEFFIKPGPGGYLWAGIRLRGIEAADPLEDFPSDLTIAQIALVAP